MQWVKDNNIGGGFTWDTSLDDFNGNFCKEGKFPLITSAINTLNGITSTATTTATQSTTSAATSAPQSTTSAATTTTTGQSTTTSSTTTGN